MRTRQRAFTLIELVVAIVIITMAAGTIVGLIASMSRSSAETITQSQSASIASAYLNEILSQPFASVITYNGRSDNGARDGFGNIVAPDYRVDVFVANASLHGIATTQSRRVLVRVTDPMGEQVWLSGFKTNH